MAVKHCYTEVLLFINELQKKTRYTSSSILWCFIKFILNFKSIKWYVFIITTMIKPGL